MAGPLQIFPGFLACRRGRSSHTSAGRGPARDGCSRRVGAVMRLDVVGIPAGGWSELGATARTLIAAAEILIGGRRHLELVPPDAGPSERWGWPSPLRPRAAACQ